MNSSKTNPWERICRGGEVGIVGKLKSFAIEFVFVENVNVNELKKT